MTMQTMSGHVAGVAASIASLDDRGVVAVGGAEAEAFLQGLLTNDVTGMDVGMARYAALLTPQGKILFDFLLVRSPDGNFLLDCERAAAADLVKRLTFYRLRAKVTLEDRSAVCSVEARWGSAAVDEPSDALIAYVDPRHPALGHRFIVPSHTRLQNWQNEYEEHRIELGVPRGGVDFAYGDTFPHEANLDRLHGVDFNKGCYVGQEVVSRVEHRGLARKRIVPVFFDADPPAPGTEIFAAETSLGHMGSGMPGRGLAMLRLDRVEQAQLTATAIIAGQTPLRLTE